MTHIFEQHPPIHEEKEKAQIDEPHESSKTQESIAPEESIKNSLKEGETLHAQFEEKHSALASLLEKSASANPEDKEEVKQNQNRLEAIQKKEGGAFFDFKSIMLSVMAGYAVLTHDFNALSRLFPEGKKAHAAEVMPKEETESPPPYEEIGYVRPQEMRDMAEHGETEEILFCFPETKSCIKPAQIRKTASAELSEDFTYETLNQIIKEKNAGTYEFVHTHPIEATRILNVHLSKKGEVEPFSYSETTMKRMREKTPPPMPPSAIDFAFLFKHQEKTNAKPQGVVYETTGIWRFSIDENSEGYKKLKEVAGMLDANPDILETDPDMLENPVIQEINEIDQSISNIQLNILMSFREAVSSDNIYELIEEYRKKCKKLGIEVSYQPFSGSDFGEPTEKLQQHHMPARSPYPPSE